MKIQLASDLHLELLQRIRPGERLITPAPGADVLVLAGDIGNAVQACDLFIDWPVPVVYVAGNHEFYGHVLAPTINQIRVAASAAGIHFLENDSFELNGVRFLGTTMWTDYKLNLDVPQEEAMNLCREYLNDHQVIRTGRFRFSPRNALNCHEVARKWLAGELKKPFAGKTVVVTHHGPHPNSVHPRYEGEISSAGFVSDLSELMPGANLWLHGHTHDSFDYVVHGCRVVANPAGYLLNRNALLGNLFEFENPQFRPNLLIEV